MNIMRSKSTEIHSVNIHDIWLSHLQLVRLYSVYIAFQSKLRMWYNRKKCELQVRPDRVNIGTICNGVRIHFFDFEVYIKPQRKLEKFYRPIFNDIFNMDINYDWTTITVPFNAKNNRDVKTIEEFLDVLEQSSIWIWLPYLHNEPGIPSWNGFHPLTRDSNTRLFKEVDFFSAIGELKSPTLIKNKSVQHLIDIYTELLENLTLNIL